MQSIEPATGLKAVGGTTEPLPATTLAGSMPAGARPPVTGSATSLEATAAQAAKQWTADARTFGRDSFAVFSVDKATGTTHIAIYDGNGELVRMIPAEGLSQMARQIAAYRRLR